MLTTADRVVRRVVKGKSSIGVGTSAGIRSLASSTAFVIRNLCCHLWLVSFLVAVTVFVAPSFSFVLSVVRLAFVETCCFAAAVTKRQVISRIVFSIEQ